MRLLTLLRALRGRLESRTLVILALIAGSFWVFVEIADEVMEGETRTVDETLLLALRSTADLDDPLGPAWLEDVAQDVTGLGGIFVLTFLTLACAGFLALQRRNHLALYLLVAVSTGALLSLLLKQGFDRPRPELVPHGREVVTSSFPSGHSMMSTLVYLTLGALLATAQDGRRMKAYLLSLAIFLAFCVGLSRVYLGVHWPSDVVAGWAAGAGWALSCRWVADLLRQRGAVS